MSDFYRQLEVFVAANGDGPYTCHFCAEHVASLGGSTGARGGVIHHVDGDHNNMIAANMVAAHRGCHMSYHVSHHERTDAHRENLGKALRGRTFSDEARARMSATAQRRWADPNERAKQGERNRQRKRDAS